MISSCSRWVRPLALCGCLLLWGACATSGATTPKPTTQSSTGPVPTRVVHSPAAVGPDISTAKKDIERAAHSEVGVRFVVIPANADLKVDGNPVPGTGRARTAWLSRGMHVVEASDPAKVLPDFKERVEIRGGEEDAPVHVDLHTGLGKVRVESHLKGYTLKIDGKAVAGGGPYDLPAGSHRLEFAAPCERPVGGPLRIQVAKGQVTKVAVQWAPKEPSLCVIQPRFSDGHTTIAGVGATVSVDGEVLRPYDGTAYRIQCGANRIVVSHEGYGAAELAIDSNEWKEQCRPGRVWAPVLTEDRVNRLHVDCHEVTVDQFDEFLAKNPTFTGLTPRASSPQDNWPRAHSHGRHPINGVSYRAAEAFCKWRALRQGQVADGRVANVNDLQVAVGFDTQENVYPWGRTGSPDCERVHMNENGYGCGTDSTAPVCSKSKGNSVFGHCDVFGNVAEWVSPGQIFGGSFRHSLMHKDAPYHMGRTASQHVDGQADYVGFRCAWDLPRGQRCSCRSDVDHARHE